MAGKEDLSNISKDQNARQSLDREPFLLQQEVGKRAYQLIKDFKQAIRSTPEFAQALQDKYFAEAQHDVFDMSIRANPDVHEFDWIEFEKGDYRYSVLYGTHSEEERLTVQKMPTKHERQGYENNFETVTLRAHINQESRQFDSGYIFHKKPDKVGTGIHNRRFAHFPSNLLKSLDRGFPKSVMRSLQPIDFRGLIKMTEPWVITLPISGRQYRKLKIFSKQTFPIRNLKPRHNNNFPTL